MARAGFDSRGPALDGQVPWLLKHASHPLLLAAAVRCWPHTSWIVVCTGAAAVCGAVIGKKRNKPVRERVRKVSEERGETRSSSPLSVCSR